MLGEEKVQKDEMRFSEESKLRFWFAQHSQSLSGFEKVSASLQELKNMFQMCLAPPASDWGADSDRLP